MCMGGVWGEGEGGKEEMKIGLCRLEDEVV